MKVIIDKNLCIGCGNCTFIVDSVFKWDDENRHVTAIKEDVPKELEKDTIEALESCPTSAIKEVKKDKVD